MLMVLWNGQRPKPKSRFICTCRLNEKEQPNKSIWKILETTFEMLVLKCRQQSTAWNSPHYSDSFLYFFRSWKINEFSIKFDVEGENPKNLSAQVQFSMSSFYPLLRTFDFGHIFGHMQNHHKICLSIQMICGCGKSNEYIPILMFAVAQLIIRRLCVCTPNMFNVVTTKPLENPIKSNNKSMLS